MSVFYDYWTGHANERFVPLKRCISGFARNGRRSFKIGISSNPNRRWKQAYKGSYDRMLVIYETRSERYIRRIEKQLTEWNMGFGNNQRLGGGGSLGIGPYYLYLVLKEN